MRINDQDIFNCDDPAQLTEWLEECEDSIEDMERQIKIRRRLETAEPDWLNRVSSAVCHTERVIVLIKEKLDE